MVITFSHPGGGKVVLDLDREEQRRLMAEWQRPWREAIRSDRLRLAARALITWAIAAKHRRFPARRLNET